MKYLFLFIPFLVFGQDTIVFDRVYEYELTNSSERNLDLEKRYFFTCSNNDRYVATFTSKSSNQYIFILNDFKEDKIGQFTVDENTLFEKDTLFISQSELLKNRFNHSDKVKNYKLSINKISDSLIVHEYKLLKKRRKYNIKSHTLYINPKKPFSRLVGFGDVYNGYPFDDHNLNGLVEESFSITNNDEKVNHQQLYLSFKTSKVIIIN